MPDAIPLLKKLTDELTGSNSLVALHFENHPDFNQIIRELQTNNQNGLNFDLVIISLREPHPEKKHIQQIESVSKAGLCLVLGYSRDYMLARTVIRTGTCDYLHWDDFVSMGLARWWTEAEHPGGRLADTIPGSFMDYNDINHITESMDQDDNHFKHTQAGIILKADYSHSDKLEIKSYDHFDHKAIAKALEYIHDNFSNHNLSLNQVAEFVSLSEKHFSRIFSKSCNLTFTEYLTSYRIDMAKHLLANSEHKVYQVALLVGYSSVEHFSRYFKKHTGYSPDQFRKITDQNRSKSGKSAL
jgi:AraC-like DNA-binding protein